MDPGLAPRGEAPALCCERTELRFERVCVMRPADLLSSSQKRDGMGYLPGQARDWEGFLGEVLLQGTWKEHRTCQSGI